MAGEETTNQQGNIQQEFNSANLGLNMDLTVNQIPNGVLTYALNAAVENFDANGVNYQNEPGNEFCIQFPDGYNLLGTHFIIEQSRHIFFLANPETGDSEIGEMLNNDCKYKKIVNAPCLNFNIQYPIHKIVHRITNCSTEIYWTDGFNPRRYLDLDNIPYVLAPNSNLCDPDYSNTLDCNQLKLQPNFKIPQLEVIDVVTGGDLISGTYQFAIQYSDAAGNPYTSYYSVTNPTPIANTALITMDFNYRVGKSIVLNINNLDDSGQFQYFNLAVIKTVNNIPSVELIGTYFIDRIEKQITYTGQNVEQIRLTINDIFEKFPYYDIAQDLTAVQDILVWDNLSSIDRINYQQIASNIKLGWETWRIPASENYENELNATNLRGYLRDEVYAFEIVFLLKNGKQTDGFHIPGRVKGPIENLTPDVPMTNQDFIGTPDYYSGGMGYSAYWKIYNTGSVTGTSPQYDPTNPEYKGPYQYGEFAYWESAETYPCNTNVWGDLAGQPIRHHKFPDINISPAFESRLFTSANSMVMGNDAVFPIGVTIDVQEVQSLINSSNLTQEQKTDIIGFKIVRGDRGTNKSIVAKGILRNVGTYEREEQTYFYPNYPYNDLREDPFLNVVNNAYAKQAKPWLVICNADGKYEYTDINTGKRVTKPMVAGEIYEFSSVTRPISLTGFASIGPAEYDVWFATSLPIYPCMRGYHADWISPFTSNNTSFTSYNEWIDVGFYPYSNLEVQNCVVDVNGTVGNDCQNTFLAPCKCKELITKQPSFTQPLNQVDLTFTTGRRSTIANIIDKPQPSFKDVEKNKYRLIFNSPETSFGNPFLGNVLKLENVIYGAGKGHFVQVKNNAKYKLLSKEAQEDALNASAALGAITDPFSAGAMFAAYQSYLTIYVNGITRKNYAYSYNSVVSYDYSSPIDNDLGIKQRELEIAQYLIPSVQNVGDRDGFPINNWYRESSVFLKTKNTRKINNVATPVSALPFPSDVPSINPSGTNPIVTDKSRITISSVDACNAPAKEQYISSVVHYASLKNIFINQWGQIYSYNTIDTGYQSIFNSPGYLSKTTIFGGDTFISRFAFKTKLPFFIDWRVNAPDDSDIFYDEIGNIAYPKYWHSSRSILENYNIPNVALLYNIISYKAHNFECYNDPSKVPAGATFGSERTYYDGYFYLFAYGIPNFYCETSYNVDLRQAFNNREGDFWPHVSTSIPDDWVQESFVPIAQDNTYFYNVTYSKQNKENFFSHLPADWDGNLCLTHYPFRAIYSDQAAQNADNRVNNWLSYRATSMFDFPQNYGKLVSLDGIQNKAILARFENKSLLYNTLLTIDTSNPKAAYMGNDSLFRSSPPIDFAETDLGYVGSQNKMLLKVPQGQLTVDAKRGQVFLIAGNQATDLSAFGSGMNRFFTDHLAFEILRYFPNADIDNHFNGIGLHGVYDSKFDRLIITKLDYIPLDKNIKYDEETKTFYLESIINDVPIKTQVYLTDEDFFCNKSWTLSYNLNTKSWVSFHSYLPNFYIGESNFYYSGLNTCCSTIEGSAGIDVLVGEISRTTTTSSSTTFAPYTPPVPPTPIPLDCNLVGSLLILDCSLAGDMQVLVPPVPTTTICQRPTGLNTYIFGTGYQIGVNPPIDSTGSLADACDAIAIIQVIVPTVTSIAVMAQSLSVGSVVYSDVSTDCTLVPDGWYFTEEGLFNGFIYSVEGGVITSIQSCDCGTTTTTTTLPPSIPECCGIIAHDANNAYYFDNGSLIPISIPGYSNDAGLAMTSNRLWNIGATQITEWIITTSPFTATFNRTINLPGGVSTSSFAGAVAIDNNRIVMVDTSVSPEVITELDITGLTATVSYSFNNQSGRTIISNMLYTTNGKLIAINKTSTPDYYITQFDYATGMVEVDVPITLATPATSVTSLYECDCNIYIIDTDGNRYVIDKFSPYDVIYVDNGYPTLLYNVTQNNSCVPTSITENANIPPTTTTTTTTI